jgi:hypothetical protein
MKSLVHNAPGIIYVCFLRSQESTADIAVGYALDGLGIWG